VVLAGGYSTERDVSLGSGSLIANALMKIGHRVLLLDSYEGIDIAGSEEYESLFSSDKTYSYAIPDHEPNLEKLKNSCDNGDSLIGKNVLDICKYADVVFIGLHGEIGENGELQAVFDVLGIKYTGTGYLGSILAMDKELTKKILVGTNVKVPKSICFNVNADDVNDVYGKIKFPCIIKPCNRWV